MRWLLRLMGIDPIQHDAKIVLNWTTSNGRFTFTKSELVLAMLHIIPRPVVPSER